MLGSLVPAAGEPFNWGEAITMAGLLRSPNPSANLAGIAKGSSGIFLQAVLHSLQFCSTLDQQNWSQEMGKDIDREAPIPSQAIFFTPFTKGNRTR